MKDLFGSATFGVSSISLDSQRRNNRTGDAETRRSEEGKMFVIENDPFPPLTSASPRLLFDFLPALMSSSD